MHCNAQAPGLEVRFFQSPILEELVTPGAVGLRAYGTDFGRRAVALDQRAVQLWPPAVLNVDPNLRLTSKRADHDAAAMREIEREGRVGDVDLRPSPRTFPPRPRRRGHRQRLADE